MFVYYFFAVILVLLSYKSFSDGLKYLNFFKRRLANSKSDFTPLASIIAPCRGLDKDLSKNLSALFRQDFPEYEIVFAVDSLEDEAVSVIQKEIDDNKNIPAKLVVAGKAIDEGQKVRNLRKAVLQTSEKSEIFVFVDSDARPDENWLRNLIAPLKDENIGCSTGYRWFISRKTSFSNELRSAWNASIASQLGENLSSNFCWGGSLAISRKTFEKLDIGEKWKGTLSDDFAVTRAMNEAKLPIFFVPQCLTASVDDCNFSELLEFTTRQMKITRVYAPKFWILSFVGSGLFTLVMSAGVFFLVFNLSFWFSLFVIVAVSVFSTAKAVIRLQAVKLVLGNYRKEINKQFYTQSFLWIFSSLLFFYNSFAASLSRKITWRGIKYELQSPHSTSILTTEKSE